MTKTNADLDAPPVSPAVRTAIHLALFAHLFAVAVAMIGYTSPSTLLLRLESVLGGYLQVFNFDVGHNYRNGARYYLTQGQETDTDYVLEVVPSAAKDNPPGGDAAAATLLPARSAWPGQRYREQVLANVIGMLGRQREDVQIELVRAIAGSVLREQGASGGTVRCLGRNLPDLPEPGSPLQPPAAEYSSALEASVILSQDAIDLIKKPQSAGEVVAPIGGSR